MKKIELNRIENLWADIQPFLSVPHNEGEYNRLVSLLDELIDRIGEEEHHPLSSLMETLSTLIEGYEKKHLPPSQSDAISALKFLMKEHRLRQSDLVEVGSQGVVSEILSGKRKLNLRQVRRLSSRFNVSPAVFIDEVEES